MNFEDNVKQRIYYFFDKGEFVDSLEEDCIDRAVKTFVRDPSHKMTDTFDFVIEYDKKMGGYTNFRYDNFKKLVDKYKKLI